MVRVDVEATRAEDGAPIEDASAALYRVEGGRSRLVDRVRTDSRGRGTLRDDGAGGAQIDRFVVVRAPGRAPRPPDPISATGPTTGAVTVDAILGPGRTFAGVVRDADDAPVPGVAIKATCARGGSTGSANVGSQFWEGQTPFRFPDRSRTDDAGRFELLDVDARVESGATIVLTTHHPGYGMTSRSSVEHLAASAGGVVSVDLVVDRGRTVRGDVVDGEGGPVRGARVSVHPTTPTFFVDQRRVETDDAGRFEVTALPKDRVTLRIAAVGHEAVKERIDLRASDVETRHRLSRGARVAGTLLRTDGSPASGERLGLLDEERRQLADASADADGRFSFGGVGASFAGGWIVHSPRGSERVDRAREDIRIRKRPPALVRVRLVDEPTGERIEAPTDFGGRFVAGASWLQGWTGSRSDFDESGTAELGVDPRGPVELDVRVDGYLLRSVGFDAARAVEAGGIEVPLTPAERWGGVVRGPKGSPAGGAHVLLFGWGSHLSERRTRADEEGRFEIVAIEADSWIVVAHPTSATLVTTWRAERRRRGTGALDVSLGSGAIVAGRVVDRDGTPVGGELVTVRPPDPAGRLPLEWPAAATAPDGTYRVEHVPSGPNVVESRSSRREIHTNEGGATTVDLVLDPA